jgi:hypothetical protein
MTQPYDQRIAYEAAAIEQAMKMGAVVLTPKPKITGFCIEMDNGKK